jgi:hypothetical protein
MEDVQSIPCFDPLSYTYSFSLVSACTFGIVTLVRQMEGHRSASKRWPAKHHAGEGLTRERCAKKARCCSLDVDVDR